MKQITIKTCGNCPCCTENNQQKHLYFCSRTNLILDLHSIPPECPLPGISTTKWVTESCKSGGTLTTHNFEMAFYEALAICRGYTPMVRYEGSVVYFDINYMTTLATIRSTI